MIRILDVHAAGPDPDPIGAGAGVVLPEIPLPAEKEVVVLRGAVEPEGGQAGSLDQGERRWIGQVLAEHLDSGGDPPRCAVDAPAVETGRVVLAGFRSWDGVEQHRVQGIADVKARPSLFGLHARGDQVVAHREQRPDAEAAVLGRGHGVAAPMAAVRDERCRRIARVDDVEALARGGHVQVRRLPGGLPSDVRIVAARHPRQHQLRLPVNVVHVGEVPELDAVRALDGEVDRAADPGRRQAVRLPELAGRAVRVVDLAHEADVARVRHVVDQEAPGAGPGVAPEHRHEETVQHDPDVGAVVRRAAGVGSHLPYPGHGLEVFRRRVPEVAEPRPLHREPFRGCVGGGGGLERGYGVAFVVRQPAFGGRLVGHRHGIRGGNRQRQRENHRGCGDGNVRDGSGAVPHEHGERARGWHRVCVQFGTECQRKPRPVDCRRLRRWPGGDRAGGHLHRILVMLAGGVGDPGARRSERHLR